MQQPAIGGTYQHYKNQQLYKILCVARDTEREEKVVVYQGLYDTLDLGKNPIFVRPMTMFMEQVQRDGKTQSRFSRVS